MKKKNPKTKMKKYFSPRFELRTGAKDPPHASPLSGHVDDL